MTGLTYGELAKFANEMRTKLPPRPLNCWVMNQYWRDLLAAGTVPDGVRPHLGSPMDYVLAMTIYIDEAYDTPILRNAAEYLAEKEAHAGE